MRVVLVGVVGLAILACGGGGGPIVRFPDEDGDTWTRANGDCDDRNASVYPGAPETCDGLDDDCDGTIDEHPVDPIVWHPDKDGDGFGDSDAPEVCDGVDQDCDDCGV